MRLEMYTTWATVSYCGTANNTCGTYSQPYLMAFTIMPLVMDLALLFYLQKM